MKISPNLYDGQDSLKFWRFLWFPTNSLLCVLRNKTFYSVYLSAVGSEKFFFSEYWSFCFYKWNTCKRLVSTRVSERLDVPLSLCPSVPLSWDKIFPLSLCLGTRAGSKILRQTPLSQDISGQNHFPKRNQKTRKGRFKTEKGRSKPG